MSAICLCPWAIGGLALLLCGPSQTSSRVELKQGLPGIAPNAITRLGSVTFREGAGIVGLAWSPSGRIIASGNPENGAISLWDVDSGLITGRLAPQFPSGGLLFGKNDERLLTASREKGRRIRVLENGKIVRELAVPGLRIGTSFALSKDETLLAVGGDHAALLYHFDSGKLRLQIPMPYEYVTVALSPDGKLLAASGPFAGASKRGIFLCDAVSGKETGFLQGHDGGVGGLAFAGNNTLVSLGGLKGDKTLRFWDVGAQKEIAAVEALGAALVVSPDGNTAASGGFRSSTVDLWDVATHKAIRRLPDCGGIVLSLAFSPDSKRLATGGRSAALRIWDVGSGREVTQQHGHLHGVHDLVFSPDGKLLASRGGDATLRLWDWHTRKELHQFKLAGQTSNFFDKGTDARLLTFSPDGKLLAAGGRMPTGDPPYVQAVQLLDVLGRKEIGRWEEGQPFGYSACGLDFSADGSLLASTFKFAVRVRAIPGGQERAKLALPNTFKESYGSGDKCVSFVPNSALLATGGEFDGIRLWDAATQKHVGQIPTEAAPVLQFLFVPHGLLLLTCEGWQGRINLYERGTTKRVTTLFTPPPVTDREFSNTAIACSPDGRLIATGSKDRIVRVWSALTGQELAKFDGHLGAVTSLAFSPDGKVLASGSTDTTIVLWDIAGLSALPTAADVVDQELAKLWEQLAGDDRAAAYKSVARLAAGRSRTVEFIRKNLTVVKDLDAKELKALLDDLDHEKAAVRVQATSKLQKMGLLVEPALREQLSGKVSPEARQRIEGLLGKLKNTPASSGDQRQLWAVFLLECLGTPQARDVLTDLAGGARGLPATRAAADALKRLGKR
jgi:WD40 repeat protein